MTYNAIKYTGSNGLYASVTTTNIEAFVQYYERVAGVPMPTNEGQEIGLHCTVMYSLVAPKASPAYLESLVLNADFDAKVKEVKFWPGHDDKGYLVAALDSYQLTEQHNLWKLVGAVPTFPEYEPHMTLCTGQLARYHAEKYLEVLNQGLRASSIKVTFGQETLADIKKD